MTAEEATVVAAAEEAIVAAKAEEAIKDEDKSSHRLIGGSNKDEGSDSDSGEDPAAAPAKVRRRSGEGTTKVRRGSGEIVGWWLENSSE